MGSRGWDERVRRYRSLQRGERWRIVHRALANTQRRKPKHREMIPGAWLGLVGIGLWSPREGGLALARLQSRRQVAHATPDGPGGSDDDHGHGDDHHLAGAVPERLDRREQAAAG